ncbi:MAG: M48 family metallopeptidase [Thermoanaerobaculia bacterium]|nr:M48 family metallopeptidase [Thermoanaerobaculia bacterium]
MDPPSLNLYSAVILAALLVSWALGRIATILNLNALRSVPPPELEGVYDETRFRRSQEYTRERSRFGFWTSTFDLAALLAFWWLGGFDVLDRWLRGFDLSELWTGLLFIGALVVGKAAVDLPFSIWSTFVIEERYGFNRTTPKTFVLDLVKSLALGAALGGPVVAAILVFFQRVENAWLWSWLLVAAVTLLVQVVLPTWILPFFYRFTPLDQGSVRQALEDYARKVGFGLDGIFVIDGSRRSTRSNAFFTGFGKTKRIALFDTLIEKHPEDELVAVLAHEVGHYRRRHIPLMTVVSLLHTGVLFFLLGFFLQQHGLFEAFSMEQMSVHAGLVFFGLLYTPLEMVLSLFILAMQRRFEFQADRFAADTAEAGGMARALRRLAADNLTNPSPHPLYAALYYSHPPVAQRIRALGVHRSEYADQRLEPSPEPAA